MKELELPKNYSGEDTTTDYTESLKKIWDSRIPKKIQNLKSFTTVKAIYNEHKKTMGPYHVWEDKLFFRAKATLPFEKLKTVMEKKGEEEVTASSFKEVFGDIDMEIRYQMISLANFTGLKLSQFDLEGNITYYFE